MQELSVRELIGLMVGRELTAVFPKRAVPFGEVVLDLKGRRMQCERRKEILTSAFVLVRSWVWQG